MVVERVKAAPPAEVIGGAVTLWRARLADWEPQAARLAGWLSADERVRMGRFREPALATRYAIGRGLLRGLLARYLGVDPAALVFQQNAYGKPLLGNPSLIEFNVSHSGETLLIAVSAERPVGVDAERIDDAPISGAEAERVLAPDERAYWGRLPAGARADFFFQTWVRKEAALKALGVGLQIEPNTFSVGVGPLASIRRLGGQHLRVFDLEMTGPIKAALAVIGPEMPGTIRRYELATSALPF